MKIQDFSSKLGSVMSDFEKAQQAKERGDEVEAKKIIEQTKQRHHSKTDWTDFAWAAMWAVLSLVTAILLAYMNIKGIYRNIYIWPFWILMLAAIFMTPLFIKLAIDRYKSIKNLR